MVDQFQELKQLKKLLKDLEPDINDIVGKETTVLIATRKGKSISNKVVKNGSLCQSEVPSSDSQRCGGKGCLSCPLLNKKKGESMTVNGSIKVSTPKRNFTCKTRNTIYLAQCSECGDNDQAESHYVGQTMQPMHLRINGHRNCFDPNYDFDTIKESALALHAFEKHQDKFQLGIFDFMILDSVNPQKLNRYESRAIGELRANVLGLNRMKIQK